MQKVSLQILVIAENKTIQNLYLILIAVHWSHRITGTTFLVFREFWSLGNNHRNSDTNVMDDKAALPNDILENIQGGDAFLLKHYF
jgi:hypothetical protein